MLIYNKLECVYFFASVVTELGMAMLVKPLQYSKASLPMEVTELGMVMVVRP